MPDIKAVIFDLDGVIVSTDEQHFLAWKWLADDESIPFTRRDNDRLRGVSRMESLEIMLEKAGRSYSSEEKAALAERKNAMYRRSLGGLTPADLLPGAGDWIEDARALGLKIAIASSSKNARAILEAVGLDRTFDVVVDGTQISRSKPDPEVFVLAAGRLGVSRASCLVIEDANAGVEAALAAGIPVLAVGSAAAHQGATFVAGDLSRIRIRQILDAGWTWPSGAPPAGASALDRLAR